MKTIDINASVGAGFEGDNSAHDEKIMKRISSANIACGFHGGDPAVMQRSVDFALKYDVAIGAHLGLPNLMGLDQVIAKVSPKKAKVQALYQIGALSAFAAAGSRRIQHVKLQGVLCEKAREDYELAHAIAQAVASIDDKIILMASADSQLIQAGKDVGLPVACEAFIDAIASLDALKLDSDIDSIAVDSEAPYALGLLDEIHRSLRKEGVKVAALSTPNLD